MEVRFKDVKLIRLYSLPTEELGKQQFSKDIIRQFRQKIDMMKYANSIKELKQFSSLNLEKLKGNAYKDCYSIRVNKQYRIIFKELEHNVITVLIIELSKHYE